MSLSVITEKEVLGKDFKVYGTIQEPLFLARDVAEWIEYAKRPDGSFQVSQMIANVDDDEKVKLTSTVNNLNGGSESWFLTEDGLYEVLMLSRKPIAKQFKKEVKKILKEIRLNGYYVAPAIEKKSAEEIEIEKNHALAARREIDLQRAKFLYSIGLESPVQTYTDICTALSVNMVAEGNYLPLPPAEKSLRSATEIARELNISSNLVGRIANQYNLKIPENGEWIWDRATNGKQVKNFMYNDTGKNAIYNALNTDIKD